MKLKDICIGITDGSHNPPQGGEISDYYMISSKNIFDDRITLDEPRYLSEEQFLSENKRTNIVSGDVLMTIVGTVGRAAVVNKDIGKITLQRSVAVLHPKKDICDSRYLMYALQSKRAYFEKEAHGVAQKGLYLKQLSDIDIVVPAIDKQVITVDLLDRVNGIIKYRQKQIEALDNLIKARFVELFGDPITNEKGFTKAPMGEYMTLLTDFSSNGSYKTLDSGVTMYDEPNYAWMVRTTDLESGDMSSIKYIDEKAYELLSKSKIYGGEIIMNKIGSAGKVYLMPEIDMPASLGRNAFMFRYDDRINVRFLYEQLVSEYGQAEIQQYVRGAVTKTITKDDARSVLIIVPEKELQDEYAEFVKQVDKSKVVVQKALDETQKLFDSLMQEYFG